jgi:hypothetical protein
MRWDIFLCLYTFGCDLGFECLFESIASQKLRSFTFEVVRRLCIPIKLRSCRTQKSIFLIIRDFRLSVHKGLIFHRQIFPFLEIKKPSESIGELCRQITSLVDFDLLACITESVIMTWELIKENSFGLLGRLGPHGKKWSNNKME